MRAFLCILSLLACALAHAQTQTHRQAVSALLTDLNLLDSTPEARQAILLIRKALPVRLAGNGTIQTIGVPDPNDTYSVLLMPILTEDASLDPGLVEKYTSNGEPVGAFALEPNDRPPVLYLNPRSQWGKLISTVRTVQYASITMRASEPTGRLDMERASAVKSDPETASLVCACLASIGGEEYRKAVIRASLDITSPGTWQKLRLPEAVKKPFDPKTIAEEEYLEHWFSVAAGLRAIALKFRDLAEAEKVTKAFALSAAQ